MKKLFFIIMIMTMNTHFAQKGKILFVMSSADTLALNNGEKLRQTGVFLNEFYLSYIAINRLGISVDFATPNGVKATIDEESLNDKYWKDKDSIKEEAIQFVQTDQSFNQPISLKQALENKENYIGLIIPGGQGLMVDLANNDDIPVLLRYFASKQKPTGLICHAPSLLLTLPKEGNPYLGYKVNAVSPFEEFVIERFIMKGKPENRKIGKKLKRYGYKYKHGLPKADYAIRDGNLVTSQNPFSSSSFNTLYIEALNDYLETIRN